MTSLGTNLQAYFYFAATSLLTVALYLILSTINKYNLACISIIIIEEEGFHTAITVRIVTVMYRDRWATLQGKTVNISHLHYLNNGG